MNLAIPSKVDAFLTQKVENLDRRYKEDASDSM